MDKPLKPYQKHFIAEYVRNGGNGTKAIMVAKPEKPYASARTAASLLLSQEHIQSAVAAYAEELGLGYKECLRALHHSLNSKVTIQQEYSDSEGKLTSTVKTIRDPSPVEISRLVDIVNKTTGRYETNRAVGNALSSQFKQLANRHRHKLIAARSKGVLSNAIAVDSSDDVVVDSIEYSDAYCGMYPIIVIHEDLL